MGGPTSLEHAKERFLKVFPRGFEDPEYLRRERDYKVKVHRKWQDELGESKLRELVEHENYAELARRALSAEQRLNLLFPQEKAAIKDALSDTEAVKWFGIGLLSLLHGQGALGGRFGSFVKFVSAMPQPGTPLRWPVVTIFPYIAQPDRHLFLKPEVTKAVAASAGIDLNYRPEPNWLTYSCFLKLGETISSRLADLAPRDNIDIQSFMWVTGSDKYV